MTAFDKHTGKLVWKSLPDRSSYASPLVTELAGVRQVVGFTGLRMVGVEASGGKLLWDLPFPSEFEQTSVTPVLWKDLVVVNGEYRPAVALRIRNEGGQVVKDVAWRNKDLRTYLVTVTGFGLWIAYGTLLGSWPVAASNGVCLLLAGGILLLRLRYVEEGRDASPQSMAGSGQA